MQHSVIVTIAIQHIGRFLTAAVIVQLVTTAVLVSRGMTQVIPVKQEKIVPFDELLKRPVKLRPELKGVHPRLFFSSVELEKLREKSSREGRELWQETLSDIRTLRQDLPDPNDEDLYKSGIDGNRKRSTITQYQFAFQIAQTAFAYAIERDEKYLAAAKKWTLVACDMPLWGYKTNKPNVDLPPAHLLYAVAFAYDLLHDKLSAKEKSIIKNKILVQGRLMYEHFKYKPGKRYTYSQNHTWIPMAGLAIAAYALMDETDEVVPWAQLSRAVFDRMIQTFGTDGFFYESFHYYGFAFRWAVRYFDAHLAATGENLYEPMRPKLAGMKYFVMHSVLPDRENVFDFADIGDGSLNRNGTSRRETIESEYDIIYRLAGVYRDAQAQTVGDFLRQETVLKTREPMWAFINRDADLKPASLSEIPLQHHFKDNDTIFWRSDWSRNATAFAFRCSPPEGHHAARLAASIPDWRQNTGHAHPDANSFIIFANGKYLTGDTGYLGIKQTDDHNTILVNGRGQEKDGVYEMFKNVPNDKLDKIRVADFSSGKDYFYARGEAASGYYEDLGLKKFDRHFLYLSPGYFVVWDELETEKPSVFTFLLNADRDIKSNGVEWNIVNGDAGLQVSTALPTGGSVKVVDQVVQSRGVPGSVDKGDSEKRGLQLRINSPGDARKLDFVHVLRPFRIGEPLPVVSSVDKGKGFRITFPDGRKHTICLDGGCDGYSSVSGKIAVHINDKGARPIIFGK